METARSSISWSHRPQKETQTSLTSGKIQHPEKGELAKPSSGTCFWKAAESKDEEEFKLLQGL